jgi:hypothetical protein
MAEAREQRLAGPGVMAEIVQKSRNDGNRAKGIIQLLFSSVFAGARP